MGHPKKLLAALLLVIFLIPAPSQQQTTQLATAYSDSGCTDLIGLVYHTGVSYCPVSSCSPKGPFFLKVDCDIATPTIPDRFIAHYKFSDRECMSSNLTYILAGLPDTCFVAFISSILSISISSCNATGFSTRSSKLLVSDCTDLQAALPQSSECGPATGGGTGYSNCPPAGVAPVTPPTAEPIAVSSPNSNKAPTDSAPLPDYLPAAEPYTLPATSSTPSNGLMSNTQTILALISFALLTVYANVQ